MTRLAVRWLLRLAPPALRRRHAHEMEALVLESLDEARRRGGVAVAMVWIRIAADLVAERLRARRRRRGLHAGVRSHERQDSMLGSDVRYAVRALARQRGATLLVLAMLALGIAANVAVFSLVNGLYLRPFPFPNPDRLVSINETAPKWNLEYVGVNFPDFVQWRQAQRAFEAIAWRDDVTFNLSEGGRAERISGTLTTYEYADVLGVRPILGRMFTPDENLPNSPPVVVIGERLWRERFGADPNVLGRTLRLQSTPYTIVGVMPRITELADGGRLWVPSRADPNQAYQSYGGGAIGRLKPGVTIEAADRDLKRAQQPIWEARDRERIVSPFVRDLRTELARDYSTASVALFVAVALLLAVACANVASVMLARALARRREMGIRLAMGASRLRVVRQLFVENLILAIAGGAVGLLLGRWAVSLLLGAVPDETPQWTEFGIDVRVAAFAVGATVLTTLLFGWAPAMHAFTGNVQSAMHDTTKGTTIAPSGRRTLRVLVGAECALAMLLLVCGGLLLRAYDRVRQIDPGFRTDHVLTFRILLPERTYPDDATRNAFWDRLEERLQSLPGVERAGLVSCAPLGCHEGNFFTIEGRPAPAAGDADPVVLSRRASPAYFPAMGIGLAHGRFFEPGENRGDGARVAVVNETFARTFWPDTPNPVGRRFKGRGSTQEWFTVVGVAKDTRHYGLEQPMRPGIYVPLRLRADDSVTVTLQARVDPQSLVPTAEALVRELDPELPIYAVRTMEQALARSMRLRAVYSWMLGVFAALALVLALGGAYGVSAFLVAQRSRELAIRVALGARSADIFRSVLGSSLATVGSGAVIGVGASLLTARLLSSLLFGVRPNDSVVLGAAIALLLATALVATLSPARRAARTDPVTALRSE